MCTPPISQPPPAHHRPSTHPSITSNTSCLSHCDRVNTERLIMQQTFNQIALARETLESRSTDHMEHRPRLSRSLTGVRRLRSDGMSIHPEHFQLQNFLLLSPSIIASTASLVLQPWLPCTHSIITQNLGSKYPPNLQPLLYPPPLLTTPVRPVFEYNTITMAAADVA